MRFVGFFSFFLEPPVKGRFTESFDDRYRTLFTGLHSIGVSGGGGSAFPRTTMPERRYSRRLPASFS